MLTGDERSFFQLVARATFSNPFGDERHELDRQIVGDARRIGHDNRIGLLYERVSERIELLERHAGADLRRCDAGDRELVLSVFLFEIYHRFCPDFDRLIEEQVARGAEPCPVSFAREALAHFARRGFAPEEARRYFALLYQVRRAYYFIDHGLIGRSACMKDLRRQLWNSVFTHDVRWYERYFLERMEEFSTLLLGETGTGKGTASAAIGRSGFIPFDERKQVFVESFTRAFVSINLSEYPETLIESELFGHRKGAFTGAIEDHEGILARCSPYGAILLDEIGDVSVPVQIKLLQVLQERSFAPVGAHERRRFRGRVIAATNRSLADRRAEGSFRDDFFYRLCSQTITVPPLRQRLREDPRELDDLLEHTVRQMAGAPAPELTAWVSTAIREQLPADYPWWGNVRELEQCARQMLLTRRYEPLSSRAGCRGRERLLDDMERGALNAQDLVAVYCAILFERTGTLAEVARRTDLDRRTVKKRLSEGRKLLSGETLAANGEDPREL